MLDALDLCLACKGCKSCKSCKSCCLADVDMASYKTEFLAHHYRGRLLVNAVSHAPLSPRCTAHQHAIMGWDANARLLQAGIHLAELLAAPRRPAPRAGS